MLNFILGPSGSGKSYQMLAELRTRAERGERSILIVPEQFTSSTEGVLYRTLGDSLSAYVESYSFTSLSEALLRRYGGAAVPTLTEAGRALLLRRAAEHLDAHRTEFPEYDPTENILKRCSPDGGFVQMR